jgi:hypothetical protein
MSEGHLVILGDVGGSLNSTGKIIATSEMPLTSERTSLGKREYPLPSPHPLGMEKH